MLCVYCVHFVILISIIAIFAQPLILCRRFKLLLFYICWMHWQNYYSSCYFDYPAEQQQNCKEAMSCVCIL